MKAGAASPVEAAGVFGAATGKTERGERHGGEAAADELAAVQLELLRDVAMDTGEGALTTR